MDNQERDRLEKLIVSHVADYRQNEIPKIEVSQVESWLTQFDIIDQPTILAETERFLSRTYISRSVAKAFIAKLVVNKELAGGDPKSFWKDVAFLKLQKTSQSQGDMLTLLNEVLTESFSIPAKQQDSGAKTYVYLDDVCFSGNQIKNDLIQWAEEKNIRDATVHIIVIATYRYGEYYAKNKINATFAPRNITLKFWAMARLENSPGRIPNAEVMWPTKLADDPMVKKWEATFAPGEEYFKPRAPGGQGSTTLFSSEVARETIEQAFLKKGAYIYSLPKNPQRSMRPLGFSALRSPGFGATVVTYRNCPNNAPLVLWWGNPEGGPPLNQWRPLLPRRVRTRDPGADFDVVDI